jgi:hypothetical protein
VRLRSGVLTLSVCLLVLAGGTAFAAEPKRASFRVTLSATLTKSWNVVRVEPEAGCTQTRRAVGRWETKLSTQRSGRVRATAAGNGRVRFSGAVLRRLAGSAKQSGTNTVTAQGQPPCERQSRTTRCGEQRRSFRGGSVAFGSPRRGILQVGSLRGARAIRSFQASCPEEPPDVRSIRTDFPLATGPLDSRDVFAPDVSRWFVTGDSVQVTTLEGEFNGRVTERVRWRLTFTRVRG